PEPADAGIRELFRPWDDRLLELHMSRAGGAVFTNPVVELVVSEHITRRSVLSDLPLVEPHDGIAQALHRAQVMTDEDQRFTAIAQFLHPPECFSDKVRIADTQ